jgi:hypothetical protein
VISNALDGTEDGVHFVGSESSYTNNTNDEDLGGSISNRNFIPQRKFFQLSICEFELQM